MDSTMLIDILNELLAEERTATIHRLLESTVFVSQLSIEDAREVQRMAKESREHAEWLTRLILECGGSPRPPRRDMRSADLHFQDLHRLLPRAARDHENLIRKFTRASSHAGSEPRATDLISRILARHRSHLDTLQRLVGVEARETR